PVAKTRTKAHDGVTGFDVTKRALDKLAAERGAVAEGIPAACRNADVIITMLPAGEHVRSVYLAEAGVMANAPPAALLIDCSTIDVATARAVAAAAAERGFALLRAPVSGGGRGAPRAALPLLGR